MTVELPCCKQAEAMVLGCALSLHDHANVACDQLDVEDFHFTEHTLIFSAIKDLYAKKSPVDPYLVKNELVRDNKLDAANGFDYIKNLANSVGLSYNIEEYCAIVKEKSLRRKLIRNSQKVILDSANEKCDLDFILKENEKLILNISQSGQQANHTTLHDFLIGNGFHDGKTYLEILEERQEICRLNEGKPIIEGITTGYPQLDSIINGMKKTNLIVVGARPGCGKSAFVINLALNAILLGKARVGMFSLEMPDAQFYERLMSAHCLVNGRNKQTGLLSYEDFQKVAKGQEVFLKDGLIGKNLLVDDYFSLNASQLRSRMRKWVYQDGVQLVFIDYLQYIGSDGKKRENRQIEVSEFSKIIKGLTRELNIPIVIPAQLNRDAAKQSSPPNLCDFRESGSIEQDADIAILLHSPENYDKTNKPGILEVHIAKNRHGELAKLDFMFKKEYQKLFECRPIKEEIETVYEF